MTYERACEVLGFTTPKSLAENAKLAAARLDCLAPGAPLRFQVACGVLINHSK